jgi:hypothetical protein
MFRSGETLRMLFAVSLKFSCTARDVLQSRGREFYKNISKILTQLWQRCVENDGEFVEK